MKRSYNITPHQAHLLNASLLEDAHWPIREMPYAMKTKIEREERNSTNINDLIKEISEDS